MSQSTKWAAMCAAGMALAGFGMTSSPAKADPGLVVKPAVIQTTGQTVSVPVQEVGWRGGGWRGGGIGVYRGGWVRPGVGVYVGRPRYYGPAYGGYYGRYRPYRYGYVVPGYGYGYAAPAYGYGYSYPAYGYGGYGYTW